MNREARHLNQELSKSDAARDQTGQISEAGPQIRRVRAGLLRGQRAANRIIGIGGKSVIAVPALASSY
jgi:hypothetical protein